MNVMLFMVVLVLSLAFGGGLFAFLTIRQKKQMHARTMSVIRGQIHTESKKDDKNIKDKRRAEIAKKLKETGDSEEKARKANVLQSKLVQAGLSISPRQFWLFSVIFTVVAVALTLLSGQNGLVAVLVGIASLLGAPRYYLRRRAKKRQKKFLADFADSLEAMVRLLKAGMPVTEAIAMSSREFTGPIGEEMSRIYEAQKIGTSLPDAVLEAARRMPITEMQMFATGVSIQAQTGSSLSEVLLNLARVIRARFRLRRKVEALSSEAKASAMIIGCLPFLIGTGLFFINRDYMMMMFTDPLGKAWLIGSLLWMVCGCLVMRQMINFKI